MPIKHWNHFVNVLLHLLILWTLVGPITKQIVSHCWGQELCEGICQVLTGQDPSGPYYGGCDIPSCKVIHNRWMFLDERQLHHCFIVDQPLILSQKTCVAGYVVFIGIPNILSLNCRCSISSSIHCFMAMNLEENVLVSTICCLLLIHLTGALLANNWQIIYILFTIFWSHYW